MFNILTHQPNSISVFYMLQSHRNWWEWFLHSKESSSSYHSENMNQTWIIFCHLAFLFINTCLLFLKIMYRDCEVKHRAAKWGALFLWFFFFFAWNQSKPIHGKYMQNKKLKGWSRWIVNGNGTYVECLKNKSINFYIVTID